MRGNSKAFQPILETKRNVKPLKKDSTQKKVFILDNLWQSLPRPPITEEDTEAISNRVYEYFWQKGVSKPLQSLQV
jgi:hypothetical protein